MKIAIISAIWQREALTKIFLKSVKRYWQDYGIQTMIAGSEGVKSREMCLDSGAGYIEVPNAPLSGKFNAAASMAMHNYYPDGVIILGSDDFICEKVIEKYSKLLSEGVDVAGFTDCYFYNAKMGEGAYWGGYEVAHRKGESIGMARLLSRKVLERVKHRPWTHGDRGLDWLMTQRLKKQRDFKRKALTVKDGYVILDIKGFGNISGFTAYDLEPVDLDTFNTIPEFLEILEL